MAVKCQSCNNGCMKLESEGVLIGLRPFNERDVIARVFTRDYGVVVGVIRGGVVAKKNRPLIGQCGNAIWNARLDSMLGTFHWEIDKNLSVPLMGNVVALNYMNSAFDLLATLLPEREKYDSLYYNTIDVLNNMCSDADLAYLHWEIALLRELGYALDLSACSGCGTHECLNYLSPRTGRAVCDVCAGPYLNRLYRLPLNLNTTLSFIEGICLQQGVDVPLMRKMIKKM